MTLADQQSKTIEALRALDRPATTRELADRVGVEGRYARNVFRSRLVMWARQGKVGKVEGDGEFSTAWVLP